jgi:hypothetical protein
MNYKDTKPYVSAFLKIDLLTDFAASSLTDFIDWRYIHSVVCIFDPACELATPPQTKMTSKDDIKGFVSLKFLRLWVRQ